MESSYNGLVICNDGLKMKYYKTGQFAKMANVSERTIRYYDKIGLLKPSFIMENGYRQYSENDFIKLQKIIALKHLGFSIEDIFPMVNNNQNLKESLDLQVSLISSKIAHLQVLKDALETSSRQIENHDFNWKNLISLVQMTNDDSKIVEQYMDSNNLKVRIQLHEKFSANQQGWFPWLYSQINFNGVYRLLEIGCGNGQLWEKNTLNLRNREFFLSDSSEGMVKEVRQKYGSQFNCIVVDCEQIPFKDHYFDSILANHVLFYLNDLDQGLQEIRRVLKPKGFFYCSSYGQNHMKEINDIVKEFDDRIVLSSNNLYSKFGLENGEKILRKYFDSVQLKNYEDSLVIDEAQPLIDYIMSCHGNQNEIIGPQMNRFKEYINQILKKNKIKVSKEAGLFICQ